MGSHTARVEIVSMFIEAILYGLYVASFVCTIYVLIYKRSSRHIHYGMFCVTVLMFVLATMHLVINIVHLLDAFDFAQAHPGEPAPFDDFSSFKNLFRTGVILTEILLGDFVLIYRCYIAWGRLRVIIIPLVFLLATAVTSGGVIYSFAKTPSGSNLFSNKRLQIFIISTQVLVFINNVICTSLLAWRLWRMSRAVVSREQRQGLRSVARIIAESGLITAVAWVIYISLNALREPSALIVLNALAPITGGAFCLIVSRVALDKDIQKPPRDAVHHRGDSRQDGHGRGAGSFDSPANARTRGGRGRGSGGSGDDSLCRGGGAGSRSILPVLDGTGRPHRPVEISVSSHESVRVEMAEIAEMEADNLYKDKMLLAGLAHL